MTPEKEIENKIKHALDQLGAYYYKNFGGPHSQKGIPDIVGTYSLKGYSGRFFAIEVKRLHGGNPTPVQIRHLMKIARNGGIAMIAASTDAVQAIYDIIKNRPISIPIRKIRLRKGQKISITKAHDIWHQRLNLKNCEVVLITAAHNPDPQYKKKGCRFNVKK